MIPHCRFHCISIAITGPMMHFHSIFSLSPGVFQCFHWFHVASVSQANSSGLVFAFQGVSPPSRPPQRTGNPIPAALACQAMSGHVRPRSPHSTSRHIFNLRNLEKSSFLPFFFDFFGQQLQYRSGQTRHTSDLETLRRHLERSTHIPYQ